MEGASRSPDKNASLTELASGAQEFGIDISSEQRAVFQAYIEALLFWRTRLSLTSAASALTIVRNHIVDSLAVARFIGPGWQVADLGSGAGFPGIPLAIVSPQSLITLIESRRKKANFLRDAVRRCGLTNAEVFEGRVETLFTQRPETFDLVVSRAVWTVSDFLDIASCLLRSGGLGIAMKGPKGLMESVNNTAFLPQGIIRYELHGGIERTLLTYRKR
ncbi:MAG: 16S rRNA (guanine(527)-N(7))-methyltransferase RsmG [Candidatus Binatia bacterium]